jgi:RNA polymerase sigma-B factor
MPASPETIALGRKVRAHRSLGRARRAPIERRLVALYQRDPSQQDYVVECFRPFALSFAAKLKRGEEPLEDLEQVAMLGLLKALDRFDPDVGDCFTAYAAPTILGELRRHYRDTGWAVHVPRGKQELAQAVARANREAERSGADTRDAAIAERIGVPAADVAAGRLAHQAQHATSMETPLAPDDAGSRTVGSLQGEVDPGFEQAEVRSLIGSLTERLDERDRHVLALRFARGMSQSAIGREIGVSQMQVSRILRRIVDQLRAEAGVAMDREDAAAMRPRY